MPRGQLQPECHRLAGFLRLLLDLKGWSHGDLALVTYLDRTYLRDLANERARNPSLDVLMRLANAFGIEIGRFMGQMMRCRWA